MLGNVTKSVASLALAAGVIFGSVKPVEASMVDSSMGCGQGTETVSFGFPIDGPAEWHKYYYTTDNGASWKQTDWYLIWHGFVYMWNGGWQSVPGSVGTFPLVGNRLTVHGYDYQVDPYTNATNLVYLGSCTTTSFFDNPYVWN